MKSTIRKSVTCILSLYALFLYSCQGTRVAFDNNTAQTYWNLPISDGQVIYSSEIKNLKSKTENHKAVYDYIAMNYKNAKEVIDANNGVDLIVVNGVFPFEWNTGYASQRIAIHHRLIFNSSDSLVRYRVQNLNVKYFVPGTSGTVSGGRYISGMPSTNVDEPLEQWITWRSENKKLFIDNEFKPYMERFVGSLKTTLK